ncbi:hypothetical protein PMZ80_010933 [Knufia obscura]|uniref:Uncharacterized protein n=1 Tax=Knufia obscura TaxID=1635080 RepID=A0ABR0R9E6_9EURO|nr:hypothetical protein PMZ80_010933 [Knufia obscura]
MAPSTYIMDESHVQKRLLNKHLPAVRDIAWAQLHASYLLDRHRHRALTDKQIDVVQKLYEDQGGLSAPRLEAREHLIRFGFGDEWSIADKEEQEQDEESEAPAAKRQKTIGKNKIAYTPISRLKTRYGGLIVDEEDEVLLQETPDIGTNQIPVGVLRNDSTPARLVTATIDTTNTKLKYTVQSADKDFVSVPVDKEYEVQSGESWYTTGDMATDSKKIIFGRHLREKSYNEIREYVFTELRKDAGFYNVWGSYGDMVSYPALVSAVKEIEHFTHHANTSGVCENDTAQAALHCAQDMVDRLEQAHESAETAIRSIKNKKDKDEVADKMKGIWIFTGDAVKTMLLRRAILVDQGLRWQAAKKG